MMRFFFIVLILFTGFDLLALSTGIGSLRVSLFLFLAVFFYLMINKRIFFDTREAFFFGVLFFVMAASMYYSSNVLRSGAYIIWFVLCFLSYYTVIRSIAIQETADFIQLCIRDSGRIQILLCIAMFLAGVERPSLLYYEPSYLSIALVPYVFYSFLYINTKKGEFSNADIALVFGALMVTMSANLLFAMLLCFIAIFVRIRLKSLIILGAITILIYYFSQWYYLNFDDLLAATFRKMHTSPDILATVLERTGNRWPRLLMGLEVVQTELWHGVGLGTFSDFSLTFYSYQDHSLGMPWLEPKGFPVTNVILELATEGGIGVAIAYLVFLFVILFSGHAKNNPELVTWRKIVLIIFALLMFESSLLRPYVWAHLAILSAFVFQSRRGQQISV